MDGSGRAAEPTAAIIDSRTLRSTPQSVMRADYDDCMSCNRIGQLARE
jgi:hypothetical protein